jgi:hypothetical protein
MNKIPVGQTIAFAYRFLISEIATIVGLAWIPAILAALAGYAAQYYGISHSALLQAGDMQTGSAYLAITVMSLVVMVFASSIVAVAVTRQVLGQRASGIVVAYFAAGRSEWRMFAASVRLLLGTMVLLALAAAITVLAFVLAGVPLDSPDRVQPTPAALLAAVISWVVFLYAFATIMRMGFLLAPVIVAEEKAGLRRSHDLIKGNFWRMLAVMLALGLPVLALLLAGEGVVLRSALGPNIVNLSPTEFMNKAEQAMNDKLLPWTIFTTMVFILGSGLIFSGAAFAYRSVTDHADGAAKSVSD